MRPTKSMSAAPRRAWPIRSSISSYLSASDAFVVAEVGGITPGLQLIVAALGRAGVVRRLERIVVGVALLVPGVAFRTCGTAGEADE